MGGGCFISTEKINSTAYYQLKYTRQGKSGKFIDSEALRRMRDDAFKMQKELAISYNKTSESDKQSK